MHVIVQNTSKKEKIIWFGHLDSREFKGDLQIKVFNNNNNNSLFTELNSILLNIHNK